MGNAGRNGGEYYTPRPLIRAIIQVVKPRIGERIYDGACGSAGFLCESFEYLKAGNANLQIGVSSSSGSNGASRLSTKDFKTLQERTFFGKEKKSPGAVGIELKATSKAHKLRTLVKRARKEGEPPRCSLYSHSKSGSPKSAPTGRLDSSPKSGPRVFSRQ
ncbi:MAG: N-6 DNA methylase [Candidatus Acidiferrum sp.]